MPPGSCPQVLPVAGANEPGMAETFAAIDHVQLCVPPGGNQREREFFLEVVGMTELERSSNLAGTEGAWYASGAVHIHIMAEPDFTPARRAHPALRCLDFDALLARLEASGAPVVRETLPNGTRRAFTNDPFGNRIELIPA